MECRNYRRIHMDLLLASLPLHDISLVNSLSTQFLDVAFTIGGWSSKGVAQVLRRRITNGVGAAFQSRAAAFLSEIGDGPTRPYVVFVDILQKKFQNIPLPDNVRVDSHPVTTKGFDGRLCLRTEVEANDPWSAAVQASGSFDDAVTDALLYNEWRTGVRLGNTFLVTNGSHRTFVKPVPKYVSAVVLPREDLAILAADKDMRDVTHWVKVGNASYGEAKLLAYWIALEHLAWQPSVRGSNFSRVRDLCRAIWARYYYTRKLQTLLHLANMPQWKEIHDMLTDLKGGVDLASVTSVLVRQRLEDIRSLGPDKAEFKNALVEVEYLVARLYRARNLVAHRAARMPGTRIDWLAAKTARLIRAYFRQYAQAKREFADITAESFIHYAHAHGQYVETMLDKISLEDAVRLG